MAIILPGPTDDGGFNTLGFQALQEIAKEHGLQTSYSEKVPVADAERVGREYVNSGFGIVGLHGGQYLTMVQKLSAQFPDVNFISVSRGQRLPPNVWNITRRYAEGFYPLGTAAGLMTRSNKVGFIAGIRLPDFVASLNAVYLAVKEVNPKAEVRYVFVGDQNDPVKARQAAEAMIAEGSDVLVSMLDRGFLGLAEAVRAAPRPVYVTHMDTDKYDAAPTTFIASLLLDFVRAYRDIAASILKGQRGGDYQMRPGQAMQLTQIRNVPPEVAAKIIATYREVAAGTKQVPDTFDRIIVP
jgi:basic membrane lipoprotein Med (substrate-binding protein (PBP1-ABC) superfamily)